MYFMNFENFRFGMITGTIFTSSAWLIVRNKIVLLDPFGIWDTLTKQYIFTLFCVHQRLHCNYYSCSGSNYRLENDCKMAIKNTRDTHQNLKRFYIYWNDTSTSGLIGLAICFSYYSLLCRSFRLHSISLSMSVFNFFFFLIFCIVAEW